MIIIYTRDGAKPNVLPKINFEKIVHADRNKVFDLVTNFERLEKTLPEHFLSINIKSARDNVVVIEERVKFSGKVFVMMTRHVTKHPELHEVFVIGGDTKGSHIVERYESVPEGTKIIVDADIKLKGVLKLAGFLGKGKIQDGLSGIMDKFAEIAEN